MEEGLWYKGKMGHPRWVKGSFCTFHMQKWSALCSKSAHEIYWQYQLGKHVQAFQVFNEDTCEYSYSILTIFGYLKVEIT